MIQSLTYRTADSTRWGAGYGSDLPANVIDLNFWNLYSAVLALEDAQTLTVSIDYITQPNGGNQFYVVLTDHQVLGPFTIPTSQWNPRGEWQPNLAYAPFDTVSNDGALYLVLVNITSAATFNPNATSGGKNVYALILQPPGNAVPTNGEAGQVLGYAAGSPGGSQWINAYRNLALFIQGQPVAGTTLMQYACVEDMTLPIGLAGSVAYAAIPTTTQVSYPIFKNGASIGAIIFTVSPEDVEVEFTAAVSFEAGDILTINAPAAPDPNQAGISITLQAQLNGTA